MSSEATLSQILERSGDLIADARADRAAKKLDNADRKLAEAIAMLEPELARREGVKGIDASAASEDRKALASMLADAYGSRGGIARRQGDYAKALDCYARGRSLENSSAYQITATYNRVQWVVVQLLDPAAAPQALLDGALAAEADVVSRVLDVPIKKGPWTCADIILLSALSGDAERFASAWQDLVASRPSKDVYRSGHPVLKELFERLPECDLLYRAIQLYKSEAPELSSPLTRD